MILSLELSSVVRRPVTLLGVWPVSSFLTQIKNQGFFKLETLRAAGVLSLRVGVVGDTAYSFSDTC